MHVNFDGEGFSSDDRARIDAVLHRIRDTGEPGCWTTTPDEIRVVRRLTDGRSGCDVLEVVVHTGPQKSPRVLKVGPFYELKGEWQAFDDHLRNASALFAPIRVATPGVLGLEKPSPDEPEGVVYEHAARFTGQLAKQPEPLESFVRDAIRDAPRAADGVDRAVQALTTLFQGVRNDLYDRRQVVKNATSCLEDWSLRLGQAIVIAVDDYDAATQTFTSEAEGKATRLLPLKLAEAALRHDSDVKPGDPVEVRDLKVAWWGKRLMGELSSHSLRLEVVDDDGRDARRLARDLKDGEPFHVRGVVREIRARTRRTRLLADLDDLTAKDGDLVSTGTRVQDPFVALPRILETQRPGRIRTLVHGDLNPRNVLLVGEQPVLIDYAFTCPGEPFFFDFTRLESCLTRDTLPDDLTWTQHVRLQRLLAAACRLDQRAIDRFIQLLGEEHAELAAAFRVLWAIRAAARDAYPSEHRDDWARDYLEQLFLAAHLTLKWPGPTKAALRASTAMAAVASESLEDVDVYRRWSPDALRGDGFEILGLADPKRALGDLASMARTLRGRRFKDDDPLPQRFAELRTSFVRATFADEAKRILADLEKDHDVYISLKAYIELTGQRSEGRQREKRSFEDMLGDDATLAESERLRSGGKPDESDDVLRFLSDESALVLIGDAGAGKSTVAREWQYRLAQSVTGRDDMAAPRLPVVVRAPDLRSRIGTEEEDDRLSIAVALKRDPRLLDAGALHVTIDALNELPEDDKQLVAEWIVALRRFFPATPVVACHRQYNYTPGLLPFPVIRLDKVDAEQAKGYVFSYLQENGVDEWQELGQRLVSILLEDAEHEQVRDLAQTPLFLWMIVERYRKTRKEPSGRGALFEDFAHWYLEERHHENHAEPVRPGFAFNEKAAFLGRLGYALVERGATDLSEDDVEYLAKDDRWSRLLDEIVESEMLQRSDGKLRFLHQSFQEYFAARHFLEHEAKDIASIQAKVWRFGWHDTFAVLLGFAGERPEIVEQVIQAALEVNPMLTARCLRMAEQPSAALLERFVETQEAVLRDSDVGAYYQERAAKALAEHGRGSTRAALLRIAGDPEAPTAARTTILGLLPGMPKQARFEPVAEKIYRELRELLVTVFDRDEAEEIHAAAVAAVASAELRELSDYLSDFVQDGDWSVRKAAWNACRKLGLELTPRRRAAFVRACEERLEKTEAELYQETVTIRMDALNEERVEILRQLATPTHLPVLLRRRFAYSIGNKVQGLVDQARDVDGEPPEEAQAAWQVLREEHSEEIVEGWWRQLRESDELMAAASAHRLVALGKAIDIERLLEFFDAELPSDRLAAVAGLVDASKDQGLAAALEEFLRELMKVVGDARSVEAFTCLVQVLMGLGKSRGRRLGAVALRFFFMDDQRQVLGGTYPYRKIIAYIRLNDEDHQALLTLGGDDARASIFDLSIYGGVIFTAGRIDSPTKLDEASRKHFLEIASAENNVVDQHLIARAAVSLQTTDLLPQFVEWANSSRLAILTDTVYDAYFGVSTQSLLSDVLRAIGCLSRLLHENDRPDDAEDAIALLNARAADLPQEEDRSLVAGLTTALGYLGEWEPLLTYLGPGEPWMHEASHNVFRYWVPKPPDGLGERERAARWIVRRLDRDELAPEVRSTLGQLLDRLEREIGYHVRLEDEAR